MGVDVGVLSRWKKIRAEKRRIVKRERAETKAQIAEEKRAEEDLAYAERVVKRHTRKPQAERAVVRAKGAVGQTENPPGSNTSNFIRAMARAVGAPAPPYSWCGLFVWWATEGVGVKGLNDRALYVPFIIEDAKKCVNGFAGFVDPRSAKLGDWVCMDFGGSRDLGEHVGMAIGPAVKIGSEWYVPTVEGNTSSSILGSQSNGGGVFKRQRPLSCIVGCARPKWSA
jgi:hypothetical protein